jgi:glycerophosphoryl diester phosphodiesterase
MKSLHPPTVAAVIGHRGAAGHAPENTLVSIVTASSLGATWVEFDVKLTRDGHAILFHDETLERTTNGKGRVADATLAEIKGLDAGSWYQKRFAGEAVPTLDETLAILARHNLGANVELKPCPGREVETGRAVAGILRARWPSRLPAPVVSSFAVVSLAAFAEAAPEFPRAFLTTRVDGDWRRAAETLGCTAVHTNERFLSRELAQRVLGTGYGLRCYTVNERARAEALFALGVESVFTDYPDRMPRR